MMRDLPFIHIKSAKFPVLPGEEEEVVNEGTYGKALAEYLEVRLKERSYDVRFNCCEDWGWWVELGGQPFVFGVCIYTVPDYLETQELCLAVRPQPGRCWSWRHFRSVDAAPPVNQLFADLQALLADDPDVELLGLTEAIPDYSDEESVD